MQDSNGSTSVFCTKKTCRKSRILRTVCAKISDQMSRKRHACHTKFVQRKTRPPNESILSLRGSKLHRCHTNSIQIPHEIADPNTTTFEIRLGGGFFVCFFVRDPFCMMPILVTYPGGHRSRSSLRGHESFNLGTQKKSFTFGTLIVESWT
jgi:hypothetical protein